MDSRRGCSAEVRAGERARLMCFCLCWDVAGPLGSPVAFFAC
jgi:hypothetical protein